VYFPRTNGDLLAKSLCTALFRLTRKISNSVSAASVGSILFFKAFNTVDLRWVLRLGLCARLWNTPSGSGIDHRHSSPGHTMSKVRYVYFKNTRPSGDDSDAVELDPIERIDNDQTRKIIRTNSYDQ